MPRTPKAKVTIYAESQLNLHTTEAMFYVNEALFEACQEVIAFDALSTAKEMAPVLKVVTKEREPGELRDSINAKVTRIGGKKSGVRATMTTSCGYGGWVELGTSHTKKEPFLWPAFEQNIQRLPEAVKQNLDNLAGGQTQSSISAEGDENLG